MATATRKVIYIVIALAAFMAATTTAADIPAEIAQRSGNEIVHEFLVPNLHTNGQEFALISQTNLRNGRTSSPELITRCQVYDARRSVVAIIYQKPPRAMYVDVVDIPESTGAWNPARRRQEMKPRASSPDFRRITTGRSMRIQDSAMRVYDLQICLECYAWSNPRPVPAGLEVIGRGGPYDEIRLVVGFEHGAVVPLTIEVEGRMQKFGDYTPWLGKVRPHRLVVTDPQLGVETVLDISWKTSDQIEDKGDLFQVAELQR
jgi:hypothetical protein